MLWLDNVLMKKKKAAKAEADCKQLKVMLAKTKAMSEYAQALIDEADEHTRKTSKQIKANVAEREEQSQAQEAIMKAISKMPGPQRLELTSRFIRQQANELRIQLSIEIKG